MMHVTILLSKKTNSIKSLFSLDRVLPENIHPPPRRELEILEESGGSGLG